MADVFEIPEDLRIAAAEFRRTSPHKDGKGVPKFRRETREVALGILSDWNRLVRLHSEGAWYLRGADGAYRAVAEEHVDAIAARILQLLQDGVMVTTAGDASEVVAQLSAKAGPTGELDVAIGESRAWDMQTGDVHPGQRVRNGFLGISADGEVELAPLADDVFHRSCLPFDWDGEVYDPPPAFAGWMAEAVPDFDDRDALYVALGAVLAGALPDMQCFIVLVGLGGSGKGTMIRLLTALVGADNAQAADTPAQMGRFFASSLVGKQLLVISDMPRRPRNSEAYDQGLALIKAITGGDAIDIERKYKDNATAVLRSSVVAATNFHQGWAQGAEDMEAWRRRVLPFAFDYRPARRIERFEQTVLGEEHSAISSFLLTKYIVARRQYGGALGGEVLQAISPTMQARVAEMMDRSLTDAERWARNFVTADADGRLDYPEIKLAYGGHLGKGSDGIKPAEMRAVVNAIVDAHGAERAAGGARALRGVRLLDDREVYGEEAFE